MLLFQQNHSSAGSVLVHYVNILIIYAVGHQNVNFFSYLHAFVILFFTVLVYKQYTSTVPYNVSLHWLDWDIQ